MRIDYLNFNKTQLSQVNEKSQSVETTSIPSSEAVVERFVDLSTLEHALPSTPIQALEKKGIEQTEANRALAEAAFSNFPELEDIVVEEELKPEDQKKLADHLALPRDAVERLKQAIEKSDLKTALKALVDVEGTTAELLSKYVAQNQNATTKSEKNTSVAVSARDFQGELAVVQEIELPVIGRADAEMKGEGIPVELRSSAIPEVKLNHNQIGEATADSILINLTFERTNQSDSGLLQPQTISDEFGDGSDQTHGKKRIALLEKPVLGGDIVEKDVSLRRDVDRDNASNTTSERIISGKQQDTELSEQLDIVFLNRVDAETVDELDSKSEEQSGVHHPETREWEQVVYEALQHIMAEMESHIEGLNLKQYVVERMTERTIQAAQEFRQFQTTIGRTLENVTPDSLHKAIEELTKALHKSEFSLFTDMVTEKKLLSSLSELDKAKSALKMREFDIAHQIVRRVRATIDAISFQPASRRIQAFATHIAHSTEDVLKERKGSIREKISEGLQLYSEHVTGRDALQLARFMGANHEIEQMEQTVGIHDIKNVRELLLRFSDDNNALLMQSTGQQMMNDSDARGRDFYMFTLPYEEDGKIEGMKVFLTGKAEENRLDWRNADLYFSLKKKGEQVGVRIRVVSGTVHFETSGFSPEFRGIQEELEEIGYRLGSVKRVDLPTKDGTYRGLSGSQVEQVEALRWNENRDSRGIDVKI